MSPHRLALRALMLGNSRSMLAVILIAASLCVLDLFAGHIASARARMEFQSIMGERLGHLAILRAPEPDAPARSAMFRPEEALRVIRVVEASRGVALVVPQMSVSGIASTGSRSALFFGEGIVSTPDHRGPVQGLPGKLNPSIRNGIAVSSKQAKSLGLSNGSTVTLTGATLDARAIPVDAEVVDVYTSAGRAENSRHPLLMPFAMAQSLLDTELTERIVVYLSDTAETETRRASLAAALQAAGLPVLVKTWQEQSPAYASERSASDMAFDSVAGMVFGVIAAIIAATLSINVMERRRETATLRALGMRSSSVFLMFVMESFLMAMSAVVVSLITSSLVAWIVNRAALSYASPLATGKAPMLVELDFNRMGMAVVTVLAVSLLASLIPAFKAARGTVAPAL
ncbi:FtsX-like permease family protein [Massilia sp. PAMC28688]|uniref:ABC transporter permease n=1 Tax=Massilia sp. PAMC28688 TaxID=2861283 RepID=UPI001C62A8E5|nr:FtsX-like permease family protein [Massilia sp. PAMC28688]QYF95206.1 FtsX-like permease family protein [Massilia sp. PAMC28688]